MVKKREAKYFVNQTDSKEHVQYRILAVMISVVPSGTRFVSRNNGLLRRLSKVVCEEGKDSTIAKHFDVDSDGYSHQINDLLSAQADYGGMIGLKNFGPYFFYETTPQTREIAREIEELGLFDPGMIGYLERLGQKLSL